MEEKSKTTQPEVKNNHTIHPENPPLLSEYKEVLAYLRKGYSVRITAKLTNVSTSTVQRLKTEFSIF